MLTFTSILKLSEEEFYAALDRKLKFGRARQKAEVDRTTLYRHVFGVGVAFGLLVASIAFAATMALIAFFTETPQESFLNGLGYSLLYSIVLFGYAIYYLVCASSIVILLVFVFVPAARSCCCSIALMRTTLVFQAGFFGGITVIFLLIQVILPEGHPELYTFGATLLERLMMIAIFNKSISDRTASTEHPAMDMEPNNVVVESTSTPDDKEEQVQVPIMIV